MADYDQLPAPLRSWLAQAALPWSPRSALRVWHRSLRACDGDLSAAKQIMTIREFERLKSDRIAIWEQY
ncbi:hypothetical protein GCM10008927_25820 [Amylibacter ulvae]|uniref:Uncharacterized protein n=2 Tax=Paramylibacter ulvae TaxID=1651968 RepID=A0ABQ3D4Y8_9RHOB|nr:hypothetical protein GCM10008927_25820 [Amylibacter ulvae]